MSRTALWITLAIFLGCLLNPLFAAFKEPCPEQPNIIVIFIDDMGYGDIGPFGSDLPTPNLDRVAQEGRKFTNFVVSSAVCSASRSALMTGCYHRRVGITGALGPTSPLGLDPEEETIAEICKQKDYATACFGKWHLGRPEPFLPTNQGFDEYLGLPYSNDMWPHHPEKVKFPTLPLLHNTTVINPDVDGEAQKELTALYTENAVRFIRENKDRPFFLYLPHTMVHVPLYVNDRFAGKSGKGLFSDVVLEIDWSVGEIANVLRELHLDQKTLLVFTSDNGPWLSYGDHAGSAGPLREGKGTSFEGGIREPTLFWMPGTIPGGTECGELASTIDLLPTIAGLIGAELPRRKIDGKDIRPLLLGEEGAVSPHASFAIYYDHTLQAIRDTRWKLVFPHTYRTLGCRPGGTGGVPAKYEHVKTDLALYDLVHDVGERVDVKAEHPEIVERLQQEAAKIIADLGNGPNQGPEVRPAAQFTE